MTAPVQPFIYLASKSPRRGQLLDQLGVTHRPLLAADDEDAEALEAERHGETPDAYVRRVTLAKLVAARQRLTARQLSPAPVLTADTVVALGRRVLGKPADAGEAATTLRALSGRCHRVLTAVAISTDGDEPLLAVCESRVWFAVLTEATIARYIASGEPFGKAGAYAVQGRIAACIRRIDGSYTGIMGLPLYETRQLLAQAHLQLDL